MFKTLVVRNFWFPIRFPVRGSLCLSFQFKPRFSVSLSWFAGWLS